MEIAATGSARAADGVDSECSRLEQIAQIDDSALATRRRLLVATTAVGGLGVIAATLPFISSMEPSERAKAEGGPMTFDTGQLRLGELRTAMWRGKPVWFLKRDLGMLKSLQDDRSLLADPDSERSTQPKACRNVFRSLKPELGVIIGVCTHLGCSPTKLNADAAGTGSLGADWPGGFFCPCHGSKFDFAGRVFKNVPAPINLEIPPYSYVSQTLIRVGEENLA